MLRYWPNLVTCPRTFHAALENLFNERRCLPVDGGGGGIGRQRSGLGSFEARHEQRQAVVERERGRNLRRGVVMPVMFPPGQAKLWTSPNSNRFLGGHITIGIGVADSLRPRHACAGRWLQSATF